MSTSDTARSLLQFFGTWLEWGQRGTLGVHDASPELMALTMAILDVAPAAWNPYRTAASNLNRDDGWVTIYQPNADPRWNAIGSYDRSIAVHSVPRPPRYVEPDPATADHVTVNKATVAALVGLASAPVTVVNQARLVAGPGAPATGTLTTTIKGGRITRTWSPDEPGCARAMATLTDEDIERAEQSDEQTAAAQAEDNHAKRQRWANDWRNPGAEHDDDLGGEGG